MTTAGGPRPLPSLDRRIAHGLFRGLALFIGLVVLSAVGSAQTPSSDDLILSKGRTLDENDGAALYANVCAACHMPDAKGAKGAAAYPALASNKNVESADYVEAVILHGLRGMPPVGRMMSDEQVADIVNYLRSHFGNAYDGSVSATDVKAAR